MQVFESRVAGAITEDVFADLLTEATSEEITLYYVYALGRVSFVWTFRIDGETFIDDKTSVGPFAELIITGSGPCRSNISLEDANVVPNRYNDNLVFSSKLLAEDYLRFCKGSPALHMSHQRHVQDCRRLRGG